MLKKKKPKKKKNSLKDNLSAEQKELLDSIIADPVCIDKNNISEKILNAETALYLLERLPIDNNAIGLISIVKDSCSDKSVQKKIRKIAFQLRQKGLDVPWVDELSGSPAITLINEKDAPVAFLGPIGLSGERAILVMVPQTPHGVDLGLGVVNSFNGIVYFLCDRYSKKRCREVKEFFLEQNGDSIETSLEHAAGILETAYDKTGNKSDDAVRGYLNFRTWIKSEIISSDKPVIYDFINKDNAGQVKLTNNNLNQLFEDEYIGSWILEPDDIGPLFEEIAKVESSPIIVTEEQQKNRINKIKEKAISMIFPADKQSVLKSMLEEMAYFYHILEKEVLAVVSLAAANEMNECSTDAPARFLTFLLDRSLKYYSTDDDRDRDDEVSMPWHISPSIITS